MVSGYWTSQSLYTAAALGIADHLVNGPRTAEQLAAATKTNAKALYRLLRALASIQVFSEDSQGQFSLTPLANQLRSDVPNSQRSLVMMMGDEHYQVWGQLTEAVRTGDTMFEKVYGKPVFDFLGQHPEKGKMFDEAMTGIHGQETQAVLDAFDMSDIRVLADVGGGNGSTLIATLKKYPQMQAILYDLPQVIERARPRFAGAGLLDRCQLIAGSFFDKIPAGADAIFMRHIIHDWDDQECETILRNCHAALPANGRVLLIESVIPAGNDFHFAKFLDLTMMLIPGGQERTEAEYRRLYDATGFKLARIVPTASDVQVIEARKK
jgi:hypothetical protein